MIIWYFHYKKGRYWCADDQETQPHSETQDRWKPLRHHTAGRDGWTSRSLDDGGKSTVEELHISNTQEKITPSCLLRKTTDIFKDEAESNYLRSFNYESSQKSELQNIMEEGVNVSRWGKVKERRLPHFDIHFPLEGYQCRMCVKWKIKRRCPCDSGEIAQLNANTNTDN